MAFFIYSGYRNHISVTLQLYFLLLGSPKLRISKEVPQGLILGPLLFLIFIDNNCKNKFTAKVHLYVDESIFYWYSYPITEMRKITLQILWYVGGLNFPLS